MREGLDELAKEIMAFFDKSGTSDTAKVHTGNEKVFLILESSDYLEKLMDASNECGIFFNLLLLRF